MKVEVKENLDIICNGRYCEFLDYYEQHAQCSHCPLARLIENGAGVYFGYSI